jgi:hypothetical protein
LIWKNSSPDYLLDFFWHSQTEKMMSISKIIKTPHPDLCSVVHPMWDDLNQQGQNLQTNPQLWHPKARLLRCDAGIFGRLARAHNMMATMHNNCIDMEYGRQGLQLSFDRL